MPGDPPLRGPQRDALLVDKGSQGDTLFHVGLDDLVACQRPDALVV